MQLTAEFTKIFLFVTAAATIGMAGFFSSGFYINEGKTSVEIRGDIKYLSNNEGYMTYTIANTGTNDITEIDLTCSPNCLSKQSNTGYLKNMTNLNQSPGTTMLPGHVIKESGLVNMLNLDDIVTVTFNVSARESIEIVKQFRVE